MSPDSTAASTLLRYRAAWLADDLDDGPLDPRFHNQGKLYRYYVSQTVLKQGAGSCPVGRVPAAEVEAAVIEQLRTVFRQPEIVAGTARAAHAENAGTTDTDVRDAPLALDPLWDELFPTEQARLIHLLVERVDIGERGLAVRIRVNGLSGLAHEMRARSMDRAA